jgi:AcrR family transcriptional regulator
MTTEIDQDSANTSSLSPSFLHFLRNTEARAESMVTKRVKSENTLAAIVSTALDIAVVGGLNSISLGDIARRLDISKSGVFARVGSLEALQYLVLAEYDRLFIANVLMPALQAPRGLPRLDQVMLLWIGRGTGRTAIAGALHGAAAFDLDLADSPLRQRLTKSVLTWRHSLGRTVHQAVAEGHLKADTDAEQLVFELVALMNGFLHDSRFMIDTKNGERAVAAYQRLISTYRTPVAAD